MKDIDDLKAEIDEISEKIDIIIQKVAQVDPTPKESEETQD